MWLEKELKKKCECKSVKMGTQNGEVTEATVLGRVITWAQAGLEYEADPRHAEAIVQELKLDEARAVLTPGEKDWATQEDDEECLPPEQHKSFRGWVAKANYLSLDRPDIQHAVQSLTKVMDKPTKLAMRKLRRLGRHLKGRKRIIQTFPWQSGRQEGIITWSDADWASAENNRKSVSGGLVTWRGNLLKSWTRGQNVIALSSAELELYAVIKAATETVGVAGILEEWGFMETPARIMGDASAALGIIGRRGLGKVRHLDVAHFWIQDAAQTERLTLRKVAGNDTPADMLTKALEAQARDRYVRVLRMQVAEGRASVARRLHVAR